MSDLLPFERLIASKDLVGVMTAHIVFCRLDESRRASRAIGFAISCATNWASKAPFSATISIWEGPPDSEIMSRAPRPHWTPVAIWH